MGDIGEPVKWVEFEPIPDEAPKETPVETPVTAPSRELEPV